VKIHSKARTTVFQRARIVEKVRDKSWTIRAAAEASGVSRRTIYKWLARAKREPGSLNDRSSRPHFSPLGLPEEARELILSMRRYRMTGERIAQSLKISRATVARILQAAGMGKLKDLEPKEPVIRYERSIPGELIHIDIKKLGRINGVGHRITGDRRHRGHGGWEYVFVAVDDAARLAFAEVYRDEKAPSAIAFLHRAIAFFRAHGVTVRGIMTDNGKVFVCPEFQTWCQRLGIKRLRTRPYRPQTNGKAERFIQTLTRGWAYGRAYTSSAQRRRALLPWLRYYNHRRPHGGLKGATPISRLAQAVNNVMRNHI
jgi:transposase InsO family protein